jgi:TonB family protein
MRFVRQPFNLALLLSVGVHAGIAWFSLGEDTQPEPIGLQRGTFSLALVSSVAATEKLPDLVLEALPPVPPLPTPKTVEPQPPKLEPPPERLPLPDASTLLTEASSRPVPIEMPFPLPIQPDKPSPPDPPKEIVKVPEKVVEPTPEKPAEKPPEKVAEKPAEKKPDKPAEKASKESVASVGSQASTGGAVDELPGLYYNPTPPYPTDALAAGLQGTVELWVKVDASGYVEWARVHESSGVRSLDDSALTTVKRWQFYPARKNGSAVAKEVLVPVRFFMRNGGFRYAP